jgi:hypothetical protein
MVLQKEDIWERLKTESTWVENGRTALFAAVPERQFRYVVGIFISGNMQVTTTIEFEKSLETVPVTYETKWSPIPVANADFRQIPKGSYSIVDPIVTFEGGTRLYGKTDVAGMSLNVTVNYWDWDV